MAMTITNADLVPLVDMLRDFAEDVEHLSPEELAGGHDVLDQIVNAARDARAIVDQRLIQATEQEPVLCGGKIYRQVPEYKYQADHNAVSRGVIQAVVELGESDPQTVAAKVVKYMRDLYVSPSDAPKVSGLEAIGLERKHVGEQKFKGKRVDVVDAVGQHPKEEE